MASMRRRFEEVRSKGDLAAIPEVIALTYGDSVDLYKQLGIPNPKA